MTYWLVPKQQANYVSFQIDFFHGGTGMGMYRKNTNTIYNSMEKDLRSFKHEITCDKVKKKGGKFYLFQNQV